MTLVFFKAMRPYDKTNGFFQNYHWIDGIAGPLSFAEAQKLSAALGGVIESVDLPEIENLEQFFAKLGVEGPTRKPKGEVLADKVNPLPSDVSPEDIFKDNLKDRPERPERKLYDVEVVLSMEKGGLDKLAEVNDIKVPPYVLQIKELAEAKAAGTFDQMRYIGMERNSLAILKAYLLKRLAE